MFREFAINLLSHSRYVVDARDRCKAELRELAVDGGQGIFDYYAVSSGCSDRIAKVLLVAELRLFIRSTLCDDIVVGKTKCFFQVVNDVKRQEWSQELITFTRLGLKEF
jgi:hypothetical protein